MKRLLLVPALALALVAGIAAPSSAASTHIAVLAHRCLGGSHAEETHAACMEAVATGAEIIDGDVRWTKTGYPVLLHDPDLRVFGRPDLKVADLTWPQVAAVKDTNGDRVQSLTEYIAIGRKYGTVRLSLEPKVAMTEYKWRQLDRLFGSVKSRVLFNSFGTATLTAAKAHGWTPLAYNSSVPRTSTPTGAALFQKSGTITAATVKASKTSTWCFECDTPDVWADMAADGVTGFITDNHVAAQQWLAQQQGDQP